MISWFKSASQYIGITLLLFSISSPGFTHENAPGHLELGVYPHLSKSHLERAYSAIATELTKASGKPVWFDASDNLKNFHTNLDNKKYDIVMLQPFDYVELADKGLYEALVTQITPLKAIFVVKESSHLQKIHNLLGRSVYFPPSKTAVSYLGRYSIKHSGINLDKDLNTIFERTHVTCLQKLMVGIADACVTAEQVMRYFQEKVGVKLRIIAESQQIPHALFAVKTSMKPEVKNLLRESLLNWNNSDTGKVLLENAKLDGFRKIEDSDFDIVRQIKKEVDGF